MQSKQQRIQQELANLEEPLSVTIKKDLGSYLTKIRYVLLPFSFEKKVSELRDWDLFGPLFITIAITLILIVKKRENADYLFAANFLLVTFGSSLVTLNAKLLGVKYSIFFYISCMGYCLAPFIIAALVSLFLGSIIKRLGVFLVSFGCYLWALKSISLFFGYSIDHEKWVLVLYPVCLFYLFFCGFIALH